MIHQESLRVESTAPEGSRVPGAVQGDRSTARAGLEQITQQEGRKFQTSSRACTTVKLPAALLEGCWLGAGPRRLHHGVGLISLPVSQSTEGDSELKVSCFPAPANHEANPRGKNACHLSFSLLPSISFCGGGKKAFCSLGVTLNFSSRANPGFMHGRKGPYWAFSLALSSILPSRSSPSRCLF